MLKKTGRFPDRFSVQDVFFSYSENQTEIPPAETDFLTSGTDHKTRFESFFDPEKYRLKCAFLKDPGCVPPF